MKLSARDAPGYFARPDPDAAGLLIYGTDTMRVALHRRDVVTALIGPNGNDEMRLTRLTGAELRKDPALALDALKAAGFFPGPRAVLIEEAGDAAAPMVLAALADWQPGDAQLVVTAGALKPTSKLRKAFEAHKKAYAAGIYDDPPSREEIERTLRAAGITAPGGDLMQALNDLARTLEPGDFRQTMEKLALYKHGDAAPLSMADIDACAPASLEADLDEVLRIVAEGRAQELGPVMRRLQSQGTKPVSLTIAATRHFRTLHALASDPGGPAAAIGRMRPPIHWKNRDPMLRQAKGWGMTRLEMALSVLIDTDLALRAGGQTAPQMALVERAFIRLAMLRTSR